MATGGRPLVAIRNVSKQFANGTIAVRDVNLDLAAGEFVSLLGPSGCGKSTLLRMVAGLGDPSVGTIDWMGSAHDAWGRRRASSASSSRTRRSCPGRRRWTMSSCR